MMQYSDQLNASKLLEIKSSEFYFYSPDQQISVPQWVLQSVRRPLSLDTQFESVKTTQTEPCNRENINEPNSRDSSPRMEPLQYL